MARFLIKIWIFDLDKVLCCNNVCTILNYLVTKFLSSVKLKYIFFLVGSPKYRFPISLCEHSQNLQGEKDFSYLWILWSCKFFLYGDKNSFNLATIPLYGYSQEWLWRISDGKIKYFSINTNILISLKKIGFPF